MTSESRRGAALRCGRPLGAAAPQPRRAPGFCVEAAEAARARVAISTLKKQGKTWGDYDDFDDFSL